MRSRRAAGVGLAGALGATAAIGLAATRCPRAARRAAAGALCAGLFGGLSAARAAGARPAEIRALVALSPAFTGIFGAGVVRGLVLAVRPRR